MKAENDIRIRNYRPEDTEALAGVYRDAVRTLGPLAYTQEQVEAWASYANNGDHFRRRISSGFALVAEKRGELVAFGQLDPEDHLAFLYCKGNHPRSGIGTLIHQKLEARARQSGVAGLYAEASHFSRGFFEKHGYSLVGKEQVIHANVSFERYRMLKTLRY